MADHSKIEWTDATWNPVTGCSVVSPGCTNCYAMQLAGTRLQHHPSRTGLTTMSKGGPVWNGQVRLNEQWITQPLKWTRPRRIFVCAHGDLFHETVPDDWIDQVFAVMALCPQHQFQVLTKRSERMRDYLKLPPQTAPYILGRTPLERVHFHAQGDGEPWDTLKRHGNLYSLYCSVPWPLPNVWLGVSVEDQKRADERIPDLLATPAAVRFASAEPLLGQIYFTGYLALLDWIIAGGESGRDARPMHPDWVRHIRDQCAAAGVPFFFKQWGEWAYASEDKNFDDAERHARLCFGPATEIIHESSGNTRARVGKGRAGRLLDGVEHNGMPGARAHRSTP